MRAASMVAPRSSPMRRFAAACLEGGAEVDGWYDRVSGAAAAVFGRRGAVGAGLLVYPLSDDKPVGLAYAQADGWRAAAEAYNAASTVAERNAGTSGARLASELFGGDILTHPIYRQTFGRAGFTDALGVLSRRTDGIAVLATCLRGPIDPELRADGDVMTRLLSVALLRGMDASHGAPPIAGSTVCTARTTLGGQLLDWSSPTSPPRDLLTRAARAIDDIRAREGDLGRGVRVLDELVAGDWTVCEHVERDGKRYLLLRRNRPGAALASLERSVLERTLSGHANKVIASDLGVSESAVSRALRRTIAKLGFSSRAELARFCGG